MDTTKHSLRPELELPPMLVEAVHDDPAVFAPAARVMAFKMVHEQYVRRDELTFVQQQALAEMLLKAGKIDGKSAEVQSATGNGYQLVINIGGNTPSSETFKGITIEQQPSPDASPAIQVEDADL
jgi:hypothetical protein